MARGKHSSPQRNRTSKSKKSTLKTATLIRNTETVIKNFK